MPKQANNEIYLYISFYTYTLGIIPLFHLIGFELSPPVQRVDYYSSLPNYRRIIAMRKISHWSLHCDRCSQSHIDHHIKVGD